jgi:hypothetical protein
MLHSMYSNSRSVANLLGLRTPARSVPAAGVSLVQRELRVQLQLKRLVGPPGLEPGTKGL